MTMNDLTEWETGLPLPEELTPLSQSLISPELASAFSIPSTPALPLETHRASQSSYEFLLRSQDAFVPAFANQVRDGFATEVAAAFRDNGQARSDAVGVMGNSRPVAIAAADFQNAHPQAQRFTVEEARSPPLPDPNGSSQGYGKAIAKISSPLKASSSYDRRREGSPGSLTGATESSRDGGGAATAMMRRLNQRNGENEEADSGPAMENLHEEQHARTLKRPRLVWTPQLHKRFVDAVAHLGIKSAVPKTIMQLMNVDGLTRENVASHLQKYRLYLKRMQGLSSDGPFSSSDHHIFASTPVPPSLASSAHFLTSHHRDDGIPIPFPSPSVVPVPSSRYGSSHINPGGPFPSFHSHAFGAFQRIPTHAIVSGDQKEAVGDTRGQLPNPSSPRQILTLFPTSSR